MNASTSCAVGVRVEEQRPLVYGPYMYGNPGAFAAFEVRAERLHQALQRTLADQEGHRRELLHGGHDAQPIKPQI